MNRRLLITGGAGYLGAELVRQARAQGWEVIATYFLRRPSDLLAHYLPLDIRDEREIERAFMGIGPDLVIHTAFRQDGPDLWSTTAEGAGAVARVARQVGAALIHLSSDAIFDGERAGAYREQDAPCPITPYGEAKAAAEQLVAEHYPGALIARTSLIYGGAAPSKHEELILDAADDRTGVAFFRDELRCPIHVGDLAGALLELGRLELGGVLHLAGADIVSRYEFARLVAAAHGRSPDRLRAGLSAESGMRRPRNCALDSGRARGLLRTQLRGVHEVLKQPS